MTLTTAAPTGGRPRDESRDAAILDKLAADFAASGNKADQLITNLVSAEPFRFVEPTKP